MSNELELNKDRVNADRYYKLFADKVGRFNDGERILFNHIGNFDVIDRFIQSNKSCSYYVIDQHLNSPWFKMNWDCKFIGTNEDDSIIEALKTLNMKFDKIIMNPPYSKNLHLKILAKAIEKLDENGTCVNLSPIRWLQDPLAKYKNRSDYKKFENSISRHLSNIIEFSSEEAMTLFNNRLNVKLGIYLCTKKGGFNYKQYSNSILDKVVSKIADEKNTIQSCASHIIWDKPMKWSCVVSLITGGAGWLEHVLHWMMPKQKAFYHNDKNADGLTYKEYRDKIIWGNLKPKSDVSHIEFETEKERNNFYDSCETTFFCYIFKMMTVDVHVHPEFLPWMGDCINPRTGKKGYESEWTDEDFYKYFGITENEQKLIEETMKKYR